MKKILFSLILILSFSFVMKISANEENFQGDIIAEIGSGDSSMLFTGDVTKVSGEVKWDSVGDYELICTRENGEKFTRFVYVRSESSLINGINIFKNINSLSVVGKEILKRDICSISENEYIVYYNCILENGLKKSYIYKYDNSMVKAFYEFDSYYSISSICVGKGYLYVLLQEEEKGKNKMIIDKFDLELNLKLEYMINTNGNDFANSIYYYEDNLYLFASTNSNDGIFRRENSNNVVLLMRINPLNLLLEQFELIGNNYDNELLGVEFNSDFFTIHVKLEGTKGFFHSINKSYSGYYLINVSKDLDLELTKCLEDKSINYSILEYNHEKILMSWVDENNNLAIKYGDYKNEKNILIDEYNKKITNIHGLINNGIFYIYVCLDNKLSKIIMINEDSFNQREIININYECEKIVKSNDNIYLFLNCENDNLYTHNFIKINKNQAYKDDILYEKLNLFINNIECDGENFNRFLDLSFGTYYSKSKFCTSKYMIIYKSLYNVPLKINIRNNEIYDSGLELEFNGQGMLNDKFINSGYLINDIGKYQLEIMGGNGEKRLYNFEISDNFVSEKKDGIYMEFDIRYKGYEKSNKVINKFNYIDIDNDYKDLTLYDHIMMILVIFAIIYTCLIIFFKRKIKGEFLNE